MAKSHVAKPENLLELIKDEDGSEEQVAAPDECSRQELPQTFCPDLGKLQTLDLACLLESTQDRMRKALAHHIETDHHRQEWFLSQTRKERSLQERSLAKARGRELQNERDAEHAEIELFALVVAPEEKRPILRVIAERTRSRVAAARRAGGFHTTFLASSFARLLQSSRIDWAS